MASAQVIASQLEHYARKGHEYALNSIARRHSDLLYVTEDANWAIRSIGSSLTRALTAAKIVRANVTTSFLGARSPLVHFGSPHVLAGFGLAKELKRKAVHVLTVYHVSPRADVTLRLTQLADNIDIIHTSCRATFEQLMQAGLPARKLRVIPLGVDTNIFRPSTSRTRKTLRHKLHISPDRIVIGSFQKDGEGWSDGLSPKYIKGPDILVDTLSKLSRNYPIHVLLSGPARGYVTRELNERGIDYTYVGYVHNPREVAGLYHALDLYLITSRVEGGPLQLLEAWASGVPVVATPVGMIPDVAVHNDTAVIAPPEATQLAQAASVLLANPAARAHITERAQTSVPRFTWDRLAPIYYQELYSQTLPA